MQKGEELMFIGQMEKSLGATGPSYEKQMVKLQW
jgi:hypothetical protein